MGARSSLLLAAVVALVGSGAPAVAQSWFARAACLVDAPRFDPEVYPDDRGTMITQEGAALPAGVGRFWQVKAPNGAVSHIWGTMHSNVPVITQLPDALQTALRNAKTVALEKNPLEATRIQLRARLAPGRLYGTDRGAHWANQIDPRIRTWIERRYGERHWHRANIYRLRASAVFQDLLWDTCNDFGNGALPLQDHRILLKGLDAGATIVGLEPQDQFHTHYSEHYLQALAGIEIYGAGLGPDDVEAKRAAQFHLYLTGQIGAMMADKRLRLDAFFGQTKSERLLETLYGWLIDDRNLRMLDAALPHLQRGETVVAIGAFHLPGEAGILRLLQRAGYRIERIMIPGEVADPPLRDFGQLVAP